MATRPLPDVNDPLTAPFWAAARESRLTVQRCESCGALRWLPAPICPECLTTGGTWADMSGAGTVWSYTVYRRAMNPAFADAVPYTVALVELAEGVRMVGEMAEPTPEIAIGQPVTAVFTPLSPEVTVVRWTAAAAS
jgi:uncharacterized OB-fold protein